ncbi:MAG: hypothetical protein ACFB0B_07730 [Thermonemataceae bacterium]
MASSYLGIFIPSLNSEIKKSLEGLWTGIKIENMASLYEGVAVFDLHLKYENPTDFDEFKKDNLALVSKLISLSEKHPKEPIVLIEEYEHGDVNSYQGVVYKAGELLLNEMGDFNFVFSKFQREFEEHKIDWSQFYDKRLNDLTSFLGIKGSQVNLFESCYEE